MPEQIIKQLSTKILAWLLGLVALGLLGVGGLIFTFYTDWLADEKAEEIEYHQDKAIMFDSPEQKEEHKDYINEAPSALEQYLKVERDKDFQNAVLKRLSHIDSTNYLNAVQNDVIKKELIDIKNQR